MPETKGLVVFSHGMLSHPNGTKIQEMTKVATTQGWSTRSIDYTSTVDPDERVAMLLAETEAEPRPMVFVGSSMGAYVSLAAAPARQPKSLFLLAPAVYMAPESYTVQTFELTSTVLEVVHGWHDDVIPYKHAIRLANTHNGTIHLVDGDHRLLQVLPAITSWFSDHLQRLSA